MFKKTDVKLETLTKELATEFANMPHLLGERRLTKKRIDFLRRHLERGTFVSPTWSNAVCRGDAVTYRLNGQHSSNMLANLPAEKFPQDLLVTIETYEFDSVEDDGFALFDIFDHPNSSRGLVDAMNMDVARYPELTDISREFLKKVSAGITFLEKKKTEGAIFYELRRHGLYFSEPENRAFALWIWAFSNSLHANLLNTGVIAQALADWKIDPAMAQEFWHLVLFESHTDPEHETRELTRDLKAMRTKDDYDAEDFHKRVKKTWDRYRRLRQAESQRHIINETSTDSRISESTYEDQPPA